MSIKPIRIPQKNFYTKRSTRFEQGQRCRLLNKLKIYDTSNFVVLWCTFDAFTLLAELFLTSDALKIEPTTVTVNEFGLIFNASDIIK